MKLSINLTILFAIFKKTVKDFLSWLIYYILFKIKNIFPVNKFMQSGFVRSLHYEMKMNIFTFHLFVLVNKNFYLRYENNKNIVSVLIHYLPLIIILIIWLVFIYCFRCFFFFCTEPKYLWVIILVTFKLCLAL